MYHTRRPIQPVDNWFLFFSVSFLSVSLCLGLFGLVICILVAFETIEIFSTMNSRRPPIRDLPGFYQGVQKVWGPFYTFMIQIQQRQPDTDSVYTACIYI